MLQHQLSVSLTNGLEQFPQLKHQFFNKRIIVFLDYDGTLTPIVNNPDCAQLSTTVKTQLQQLHNYFITGVISGRSLDKLQDFVNIDGLFYAGSHGFDIAGPNGASIRNQVAADFLPLLAKIRGQIDEQLEHIEGAQVEDNVYSLSVHYRLDTTTQYLMGMSTRHRNVAPDKVPEINGIVERVVQQNPTIRRSSGKMVFELKPNIEWNKGKALLWLLNALGLDQLGDVYTIYIGDDTTDEDAFEVFLQEYGPVGIGVKVTEESIATKASLTLRNPGEVSLFLNLLLAYGQEVDATPQLDQLNIRQDAYG